MKSKVALFVLNLVLGYLKSHPELVDQIFGELAKRIPGEVDDALFAALGKLIK